MPLYFTDNCGRGRSFRWCICYLLRHVSKYW